jgi:TolA-binding protein
MHLRPIISLALGAILVAPILGCTSATRKPDTVSLNLQQDMRELVSAQKFLTARLQMVAERMSLLEDRLAVQEANLRVPLPELPVVKLVAQQPVAEALPQPLPAPAIKQSDVDTVARIPTRRQPSSQLRRTRNQRPSVRAVNSPKRIAQQKSRKADPSSILSEGTRLVNLKEFDAAVELMRKFRDDFGQSDLTEYTYLIEGRAYFERGSVSQAIRVFGDLIEQFPNGATVPDALYMVGLSQDRLGNTSRAVETLARLKTIYPATEAGKRAAEALSGRSQSL